MKLDYGPIQSPRGPPSPTVNERAQGLEKPNHLSGPRGLTSHEMNDQKRVRKWLRKMGVLFPYVTGVYGFVESDSYPL